MSTSVVDSSPNITNNILNSDDYELEIRNLITGLYSDGWYNATNYHDSSFITPYTVPGSSAYNMLGIDYWSERPDYRFNFINDVCILKVEKLSDTNYNAYVYYTYEIYNPDKNKTSSNIELAIDHVSLINGQYLVDTHNWKNDIPVGSIVTLSDYN